MKRKIRKIETLLIALFLIGTVFFVPVGSVNITSNNDIKSQIKENEKIIDAALNIQKLDLDTRYIVNPAAPSNKYNDNDDAGYKDDAGDEIKRSYPLYPNEMKDNWPGRGSTGKLSSEDEEDWFFFPVCDGQDIEISMTPPDGFDFDMSLWDNDGDERASSSNPGSVTEEISFKADMTDNWYLGLVYVSGSGDGQYTFDVTLSGQNDAETGDDAGDDFASATPISEGTYNGFLDMNDEEDWYKFYVESGQGIHFILEMRRISYQSDFDIYLYNPSGELVHYENFYYDDELLYPADENGEWRAKIKIFPGYTDIPQPTEWDYYTYGSGPYEFEYMLESSAPEPPGPIPQPDITPIAHTFKVENDPDSNKDEFGYLASVPACNYLEVGKRYLAPILYTGDDTATNWFGTVDDTTNYLLEDWNDYLTANDDSAIEYIVPEDPVQAAADIATNLWESSDLAVVAVDGSSYDDTTEQVLEKTRTLSRKINVETLSSDSSKWTDFSDFYAKLMFIGPRWGAIQLELDGVNEEPSLIGIIPQYMRLCSDWWPEHSGAKTDIYYPIPTMGIYAASVIDLEETWTMKITKYACHRYNIKVTDTDSVLSAKVTTSSPEDLMLILIDPEGNIRAPIPPDWNGGSINSIHEWNGIDNPDLPPDCDQWQAWEPEPSKEVTAEVLHPDKGTWQAIVVPRYQTGTQRIKYTITADIKTLNQDRINAAMSAANAAVIASQEHAPLLYVTANNIPSETQAAFDSLGVNKVIFVQSGGIGSAVESSLPNIQSNLKSMKDIVDFIKDYSQSENYITITSLKSGNGYFAPSAMLAAYHCSPVLRIGEAPDNPASKANVIEAWKMWGGDYYHGNRAPNHLPLYTEPVEQLTPVQLILELLRFVITGENNLPPLGMDAKRYWLEDLHNTIHDWVENEYGLDLPGQESYVFVSPRDDINIMAHSVMMGNNSYSGHIPGFTTAYINDIIIRNVLYPALIYANPNRDVTTTQLMNFPDRSGAYNRWTTNDGELFYPITSSYHAKKSFSSHNRIYEGHCLWDAYLERMNEGASIFYYAGHGTGGSGMSSMYIQTENCNYPDQVWPDGWRSYVYDSWEMVRDDGTRWFNPEPPLFYDIIHYKYHDELYGNLRSNAIFYQSCSTGQQFGPMVYLDHGALCWYGNAETGSCPPADLEDDWFFEDILIHGENIGEAYSKNIWRIHRDYTTCDPTSIYGQSSTIGDDGLNGAQVIYCDPTLIIYSPSWTMQEPIQSNLWD